MSTVTGPPGSGREAVARRWAAALAQVIYVPRSRDQIEAELGELVDVLVESALAADFDPERVSGVGAALVAGRYTKPVALRSSLVVLGEDLFALPELRDVPGLPDRLFRLLAEVSAGYAEAIRQTLFAQQEDIRSAMAHARENVERALVATEARFREVFTSTAVGMVISTLDGKLVEANAALTEMLGHPPEELAKYTIFELFDPADRQPMRARYQRLAAGAPRFRDRCRLATRGDDTRWVIAAVSLMKDNAEDVPGYYVTMVEDITELHLLQARLSHQVLHDVDTGLANRQHFLGQLDEALLRQPGVRLTVFQLDLDQFAVINDGLGHQTGQHMLQVVAQKLRAVFTGENVVVARIGGDEFAVLLEHSPATPDVAELASRINESLTEPTYVDDQGIAVSASIGVVRIDGIPTGAEVMRAADATQRRVRAAGSGQWDFYDPVADTRDRIHFTLAATLPGAWESGELTIGYQPVVSLADERITAIRPVLRWDHPERGTLSHDECLTAIERIGMGLPIGRWVLKTAIEHATKYPGLPLSLGLCAQLANDPDLVATVTETLADTGLPPESVQLGFPAPALHADGEAEDNLTVLAEKGLPVALEHWTANDLTLLETLPIHTIQLAVALAAHTTAHPGTLPAQATTMLLDLLRPKNIAVVIPGLTTASQATWWYAHHASAAHGPRYTTLPNPTHH